MSGRSMEELQALVEEQEQALEMAASVGQMLLQENQTLKQELRNRTQVPDLGFAEEIQKSLIQQSRQLSLKLQEEYDLRFELENELDKLKEQVEHLQSKNLQLKKKNDGLVDEKWTLEQRTLDLTDSLSEKDNLISRLKKSQQSSRKSSGGSSISESPKPISFKIVQIQTGQTVPTLLTIPNTEKKTQTDDEIEISSCERCMAAFADTKVDDVLGSSLKDDQFSISTINEICENCETLKRAIEVMQSEKQELQTLLDKSYEAYESLQSESFLSQGSMVEENVIETLDDQVNSSPINIKRLDQVKTQLANFSAELEAIALATDAEGKLEILQACHDISLNMNSMADSISRQSTKQNLQDIEDEVATPKISKKQGPVEPDYTATKLLLEAFPTMPRSSTPGYSPVKESSSRTKSTYSKSSLEDLTYTMVGSWFIKYNRFNKKPHLRFCWVNPYKRLLNWSEQPPSERFKTISNRSAYIVGVQYADGPMSPQNYPPSSYNSISIATSKRMIKLVPVSWEIHDHWIGGISYLLRKSKNSASINRISIAKNVSHNEDDSESDNSELEILSDSDNRSKHRRIHTLISNSNSKISTPKKIRNQHLRRTTVKQTENSNHQNPFIVPDTGKVNALTKMFKKPNESKAN